MAELAKVTDGTFEQEVLKAEKPVIVHFWAPWCGPCRMANPVFQGLAPDYEGKVEFVKLNTDDNQETATKYGVETIPTFLVFRDGEVVESIFGFKPASEISARLDQVLE